MLVMFWLHSIDKSFFSHDFLIRWLLISLCAQTISLYENVYKDIENL